jgi:hypothetical protein
MRWRIIEDAISISWTGASFANDGMGLVLSDGARIPQGAEIATGNILTLGVAPIAEFRAALGLKD